MKIVLFFLVVLPIESLWTSKSFLCNQSIENPQLDATSIGNQNLSISFCNLTFDLIVHSNKNLFNGTNLKGRFAYLGSIRDEHESTVSLILYPQLEIYIYSNGTYFYYLSYGLNSSISLTFSQRKLLHYFPLLVNDSLWKNLQEEEEIYQKNSLILHDFHFIYEILTLRCQSSTISFCSLALYLDEMLFEKTFSSNIFFVYNFIEHFNFLLRSMTKNEYEGFLLKRLILIPHVEISRNTSFDYLHQLSKNISLPLKEFCLNHQMFFSSTENDSFILGYQSSIHTYDIGGICSSPFYLTKNQSEEINLNTGLSLFNENSTRNGSMFFNSLMRTSYLFLRQMGLNLTLCSINASRRGFFQFNTILTMAVPNCLDLLPLTLHPALKRRAHLCFNHLNLSHKSMKEENSCEQSISLDGDHRKSPYIENALNDDRRGQWFEGNIVGLILSLSLFIWIPVSCFVHFCIDEINKKSLMEKQQQQQQQQEMETVVTPKELTKQTQTD